MSVYIEHADGSVELISPDYSEGELLKLKEEAKAVPTTKPVSPNILNEVS